jgi:hypothetical protein
MSNSVPPEQRPPRLRDDEPIAILVALLAFGAIFAWSFSQGGNGLNLLSWLNGAVGNPTSSSPQIAKSPLATESPFTNPLLQPPQKENANPGNAGTASAGKPGDLAGADEAGGAGVAGAIAGAATAGTAITAAPTPGTAPTDGAGAPSPSPGAVSPSATASPNGADLPVPSPANPLQAGQRPVPPPAASPPIDFPDVSSDYWAYPFIRDLSTRGIIGGFPNGTFQPDQPVTRGQFAVQLQKAFTKPDKLPPKAFADVPENYAIAVDKAVKSNFMSGYPDGNFRPDQNVSRTEAVISLIRGLGLPEPADPEAILQAYQDQDQVPSWARAKIAAAIQAKVFSGDPDTMLLNPRQPATRADIAAFVYKGLGLPDPPQ